MANIDITLTDTQYNQLVTVTDGLKAKLGAITPLLAQVMQQENGRGKVKAFVKNNPTDARLLVLTNQLANYLDDFREAVRWADG